MLTLRHRRRPERAGHALYRAAVAAARAPVLYSGLGVPDTLDGRFDLVSLHAFLLIRRVQREGREGADLAQAVFDAMFADMDQNLREMGVGDLAVPMRVRRMWEAFHGRANAYAAAFEAPDPALAAALARNVWRGAAPGTAADRLASLVRAQDRHLASQDFAALRIGAVRFLPAEEVLE